MHSEGFIVETLTHSSLYSSYAKAFTGATGLPIRLRAVQTWQLPFHGQRNENGFCALMASRSATCAACLRIQEKLSRAAMQHASIVTCPSGLSEVAVPVRLGKETLGLLQTGQIFRQEPGREQFERVVARVKALDNELKRAELEKAYFQTPVLSEDKVISIKELLSIFAEHLAMKSNQIAVQSANAQPPIISHAKQYILEHLTEHISLGQVANDVHTNTFYFCKLFRRFTGITFTEFVARTRTEKAKQLLLNPNLRVCEIAYRAGFRSLTHFNRTFKAIAGQSPSDYRLHLPKVARNI